MSDWICAVEPVEEGVILACLLLMCLSILMGQKMDKNLRIGVFVKANAFIESFPHSSIIIRYATHLMMLSSDRIIKIEEVVRFLPTPVEVSRYLLGEAIDFFYCCCWCGRTPALCLCSRCQVTRYCSPVCQKAHWKIHKDACSCHVPL